MALSIGAMPWDLITKELSEPNAAPDAKPTLIERLRRVLGFGPSSPRLNSTAFTIALVSLSAKLAKADGVALPVETQAFERLHRISPSEQDNIRRMFGLAAQDVAGFETYASRIADLLRQNTELLRDVLEGLFFIATADGILHPEEERHLRIASELFGLSAEQYRDLRARYVHDPDDPYAILGLTPDVSDKALKQRFLQLVREYHPDRQIARGVAEAYVTIATDRLAAINAAYDRIVKERGL